jgi:hypothetical protein
MPTRDEALRAARVLAGLEPDLEESERRIKALVFGEIEKTGYLGPEVAIQSWIRLHELYRLSQKFQRIVRQSAAETAKDVELLTTLPKVG